MRTHGDPTRVTGPVSISIAILPVLTRDTQLAQLLRTRTTKLVEASASMNRLFIIPNGLS